MNQSNLKVRPDSGASHTLLTGATGLVGQYLMRDLLLNGTKLAVLVRPKRSESAEQRIEQILLHWESELGREIPRPIVIAGDVAEPKMGFADKDQQWLSENCDTMIHNAAILRFQGTDRQGEPWRTNVGGTRNVLEVARDCGISKMHYVSTAYVCGNRDEKIFEPDFNCEAGFRNDYERSKFEAEEMVRDTKQFDSVTIYRPVVIAGDSQTGFTSTYHGLYVYLRLFAMFIPEQERDENGKILTPVIIPMEGDQPRNVVPVDWVSSVFCEIFHNPSAHGLTYHLAPERRMTPQEVIDACYSYFDSHGVEFCGGDDIPTDYEHPDYAEKIFDNIAIYQQYESSDPLFDTTNLKRFAGHIECPIIDADTIHRFLNFGNAEQWGKRRPLKVVTADESSDAARRA